MSKNNRSRRKSRDLVVAAEFTVTLLIKILKSNLVFRHTEELHIMPKLHTTQAVGNGCDRARCSNAEKAHT